jgi:hypothetical protein
MNVSLKDYSVNLFLHYPPEMLFFHPVLQERKEIPQHFSLQLRAKRVCCIRLLCFYDEP